MLQPLLIANFIALANCIVSTGQHQVTVLICGWLFQLRHDNSHKTRTRLPKRGGVLRANSCLCWCIQAFYTHLDILAISFNFFTFIRSRHYQHTVLLQLVLTCSHAELPPNALTHFCDCPCTFICVEFMVALYFCIYVKCNMLPAALCLVGWCAARVWNNHTERRVKMQCSETVLRKKFCLLCSWKRISFRSFNAINPLFPLLHLLLRTSTY